MQGDPGPSGDVRARPFRQVDVFTSVPCLGNPVAVVLDGSGLSSQAMQRFTDWTHLSEATFVLPPTHPDADYRLRVFCPGRELPFAGHPTLGTCHAWLESGGRPRATAVVVQECEAGLVRIRRDGLRLAFAAPAMRRAGPLAEEDVDRLAQGLRVPREAVVAHSWCDNGPPWRAVMLPSAADVLALRPDRVRLDGQFVGVVGAHEPGAECAYEVRAFFPGHEGLVEDPVTGSLNAALAHWLIGTGLGPDRYVAAQGTALGRAGRVHVERDAAGETWIGGESISCIAGHVTL